MLVYNTIYNKINKVNKENNSKKKILINLILFSYFIL